VENYWKVARYVVANTGRGVLSGAVHTRGESLWNWLGDVQTYGTTLALAYVLHHLSAMWLQL